MKLSSGGRAESRDVTKNQDRSRRLLRDLFGAAGNALGKGTGDAQDQFRLREPSHQLRRQTT
jgi:hypothetical protein